MALHQKGFVTVQSLLNGLYRYYIVWHMVLFGMQYVENTWPTTWDLGISPLLAWEGLGFGWTHTIFQGSQRSRPNIWICPLTREHQGAGQSTTSYGVIITIWRPAQCQRDDVSDHNGHAVISKQWAAVGTCPVTRLYINTHASFSLLYKPRTRPGHQWIN